MFGYILWAICAALDLTALLRVKNFPVFKSYLAWKIFLHVSNLAAFLLGGYSFVYWLTTFVNALFGMAVTCEVFSLSQARFQRALLWLLVLIAAISYAAPIPSNNPIAFAVYSVQRVLFFVSAGLMAYSLTFKPLFGRERYGIALGFALFSATSLLRSALGYQVRHLPTIAYIVAQGIWLVYLQERHSPVVAIPKKAVCSARQEFRRQRIAVNSFMKSTTSCD